MFERPVRGPAGCRRWTFAVLCSVLFGCAGQQGERYDRMAAALRKTPATPRSGAERDGPPFERAAALERRAFVREVLRRNPSIEAARQAWRAALAEYPQRTALDDPMLEYSFAPLSIGSNDVRFGQVIAVSQRFPWPGKLELQGEVALAEAEAARENFEAARRGLAAVAASLFDEYYASERALEINRAHRALVAEIKSAAEAQYAAGRASQQEPLQAEIELAHVEHDRVVLESRRSVIAARMNGLLRRRPDLPLPPPPRRAEPSLSTVGESGPLRAEALSNRPELRAAKQRIRGRQSAVELADRRYYPDFGVSASYNSMWDMPEHQWMVGLSVNIPIQTGTRGGAVEQAEAARAQTEALLLSESDDVGVEVERARHGVIQAQHVVRVYRERLLPAARAQIEVARIGYSTGRNSFQALIDAERSVRNLELSYEEALAGLGRAWAELDRAVGRIAGMPETGESP